MNRRAATAHSHPLIRRVPPPVYPFTAIVGQEEMKLALLLNVIEPLIGGVLIMGHRGTGKSTAVRALADLLPPIWKTRGCVYGCDPLDQNALCEECSARLASDGKLARERAQVPVVDLPLGATEDRVCGTINIERALTEGLKAFEPGLLARANRGFLYIDEVNLLEDHLIDLLLDTAVTGRNIVEREGISVEHPARFVLIGSGNPEEGELRPQLLDRFGLHVEIKTAGDLAERVEIVERCEAFERDPLQFRATAEPEQERLRRRLTRARKKIGEVKLPRELLRRIAELCLQLKVDGHRGELTITRAARALAALEGRREVSVADVRRVATMALRHRLRRDPLDQTGSSARIEQKLDELLPAQASAEETWRISSGLDQEDLPPPTKPGGKANNGTDEGGEHGGGGNAQGTGNSNASRIIPPLLAAQLPDALSSHPLPAPQKQMTRTHSAARRRACSDRSAHHAQSGRYVRAVATKTASSRIALDATLRAAAQRKTEGRRQKAEGREQKAERRKQKAEGREQEAKDCQLPTANCQLPSLSPVSADALRYKKFKRKNGTLFIFAVDTSGSMALNRLAQAKGALVRLLQQSYVKRDRVALVSFRGVGAEINLPPCRSLTRARRILDSLPVGGSTPLAAGLVRSLEIAKRAARQGAQEIILLLFTDGRANVSFSRPEATDRITRQQLIAPELERLGAELRAAKVAVVVVDTQNRFTANGEGRALAEKLGGRYIYLSSTPAASQQLSTLTTQTLRHTEQAS